MKLRLAIGIDCLVQISLWRTLAPARHQVCQRHNFAPGIAVSHANLCWGVLGSGRVDQSQKMTVAARAIAERKTIGHLS